MERGLKIIFLLLILILSLSIVSAGFFSDFWNKITGKSVETCTDSDNGLNYSEKGVVYYGQNEFNDYCLGSDLVEWYCKYNEVSALKYKCPETCQNGACISGECTNYYADKDNDGYGDSKDSKCLTSPTEDYKITIAGDCNDDNATINPGADEVCDNIDNNCDGKIDEGCPGVDTEPPQITIIYPQTTTYPSNITTLNYSVNDDNLESCWYSLDNGVTNSSPDQTCSNYTDLSSSEGSNTWIVYANDTFGNWISKSVTFNIGTGQICEDGTLYGKCSSIKPKYCDNGNLINNCSLCGCPLFYECQSDGNCSEIITVGDSDNDGIENIHDPDANGDGVMDASYASINANKDIDGDGILNINDKDIDGDGILNGFDVAPMTIGTIEITEGAPPEEITDFPFQGYIVELENEPLAVQISELEEQAEKNEGKVIAQVAGTFGLTTTHSNLEKKIKNEKARLRAKRDNFKQDALKKLGKNRIITGSAVAEENELVVLEEYENVFNGLALNITLEEAEKIKDISGVKKVHLNYEVKALLMDSVPLINADDVWQLDNEGNDCSVSGKACLTGQGVTVGIIDTGVDYSHTDLGGCFGINCKVVGGYDFVNNDNDPMDDHGHGTHCAATVAGKGVLKGVAPDAKLYAYKVLNSWGSGSWDDVIAAIERSVDPNQDGNFSDHLDIISLSLGGWGNPDDPVSKAIDNAVDVGVVAVIAAGNSGPWEETIGSPGTARKAITIGATDKDDYMASFSSRGPVKWTDTEGNIQYLIKPDIVAPGVSICAAQWNNAWSSYECLDTEHTAISGTSMATPHVAGASALLLQKNPTWSPEEIKMALRSKAIDIGENINIQGYGKIDSLNAINFKGIPSIAKFEISGKVSEKINIIGTAGGKDFKNYTLYYGEGENPVSWAEITSSNSPIESGVLYKDFDTTLLNEGINYFRLIVWNNNGEKSEDRSLIIVDNINIKEPLNSDIYRTGTQVNILGSVKGDFNNFIVEYQNAINAVGWSNNGITLTNGGTSEIIDNVIATWDTTGIANGMYDIRLVLNLKDERQTQEFVWGVYFDNTLKQGWPQRIEFEFAPEQSSSNLVTLSEDTEFYTIIPNVISPNQKNSSITMTKEEMIQQMNNDSSILSQGFYYWAGFIEPVVSDINKDGNKEIIIYKGGNPPKILVYNSNGSLLWSVSVGTTSASGGNLHIPLIGDIDNDGYEEIIAFNIKPNDNINSELYVFNHDGSLLWFVNVPNDFHPTMLMADLDLDGNKEIVIKGNGALGEQMAIVSNQGQIVSQWSLEDLSWGGSTVGSPAIGNFDDDAELEIVSAGPSGNAGYNWETKEWINEGVIYVYNMDGSVVSGWPIYTDGIIFSSPVVGDINNDGNHEIVVGLMYASDIFPDERYGGLYAFDRNGNILPGWPVEKGYNFWSTPALGDIDNDSYLEIAVSRLGFVTYLFNHDGVSRWIKYTAWNDYYGSLMGDINNDNSLDVLTTAGGIYSCPYNCGGVYAWHSDPPPLPFGQKPLSIINGFPKVTEIDAQAPATIADIDNDGKVELIASSDWDRDMTKGKDKYRGSIYVWDLNASYNSSTMEWPMFMHDPQHTGLYVPYGEEIDDGDEELCTSHESDSCYDNDVYWYDSCGNIEEKKQECGGNFYKIAAENGKFSCSSIKWDRYCDGDHKKRDYLCYENTCSGNSCQVETHIMDTYSKYCRNGCRRGRCRIWLPGRRKVICTELYDLGYLDEEKYEMDLEYAAKHFSQEAIYGYQAWAIPVVKAMRKNPEETRENVVLLVNAFIEEIAYRMGKQETGNEVGAMFLDRGMPLFERIGKHINEPDWRMLFNEENLIYKILDKLQNNEKNEYDDLVRNYFSEDKIREMYFDAKEKSNGSDIEFANALLDNLEKAVEEIESMIEKEN